MSTANPIAEAVAALITRLEALQGEQMDLAKFHADRHNLESAAVYRCQAAGIAMAVHELRKEVA